MLVVNRRIGWLVVCIVCSRNIIKTTNFLVSIKPRDILSKTKREQRKENAPYTYHHR